MREQGMRECYRGLQIFGKKEYKDYLGVDITDEYDWDKINIVALRSFMIDYFGKHPVHTTCKLARYQHLIPIVLPTTMVRNGSRVEFNMERFAELVANPQKGHAITISLLGLGDHAKKIVSEPRLLLVLKTVVGVDESWEDQIKELAKINDATGFGCSNPSFLQLFAFGAHYLVNRESGLENFSEGCRMQEKIKDERICTTGFGMRDPQLPIYLEDSRQAIPHLGVLIQKYYLQNLSTA